jgi:hypothetical protein
LAIVLDRVAPEDIDDLWPYLEPPFRRACEADPTGLTSDMIRREAIEGRRHVWTLADGDLDPPLLAALSTRVDGDALIIGPLGGTDMHLWLPLLSVLEGHAKTAGLTSVRIEGRRGWQRALKPYGYRLARITLERNL